MLQRTAKDMVVPVQPPKKIDKIQFGMLSDKEIEKMSEVQIVNHQMYQIATREPTQYGCLDRRLGTSDKSSTCETCGCKLADCPGHFGFIRLELPVFHPGFFRQTTICLQCICKNCSRVLLNEEDRMFFLRRLRHPKIEILQKLGIQKKIIEKCKKTNICPYCESANATVKKFGALRIIHDKYKSKVNQVQEEFNSQFEEAIMHNREIRQFLSKSMDDLNPLRVLSLFERILPDDVELLIMNPKIGRPERMLMTHVPVPPVAIRPSVGMDAQGTNEDDLTVKLAEITQINNTLRTAMEKGSYIQVVMENWDLLQLQCALYINSDLPGQPMSQGHDKPLRGISQRLKGKTGRFRGNLSGKRVDFSGRTVISPDPNLRIDEVGVPELVAMKLTYPEKVNETNLKKLQKCVINGPEKHPGALYIKQQDGMKRYLGYGGDRTKFAAELRIGDTVERHLENGDCVLFNRQPSLHKLSIMCHRARVMPWRTFRFNECVCTPYNADFDGDEMNLHLPQTEEARAEALVLMGVLNNLITPRNGEPLVAATQDFLTASYIISKKDTFLDRAEFCQMCAFFTDAKKRIVLPKPAILKPVELWTGKQVFQVVVKANESEDVSVNFETRGRLHTKGYDDMCPRDGYVRFQDNELLCGTLCKTILGSGSKDSIFHILIRNHSSAKAAECMSRVAKLCARYLGNTGFSIGIDDVQPSPKLLELKMALVERGYEECREAIQQYQEGKLAPQPGCNLEQSLEAKLNGVLSKIREDAGSICIRELHPKNSPLIMALCGSKGSNINISQMIACVGQQTLSGSRIPNGFIDRSLPHFPRGSKEPAAKGFVQNSFYSGLTATEFFYHTMGGREGLVDTAVKTAETGYMQRRLMKALEDLSVHYDDTVRSSSNGVVQFVYGDDGLDPASMEGKGTPVDFSRVLLHVKGIHSKGKERCLYPYEITEKVLDILQDLPISRCSESFLGDLKEFLFKQASSIASLRVRYGLPAMASKDEANEAMQTEGSSIDSHVENAVNSVQHWTLTQLRVFLRLSIRKYHSAITEPGTAVGALGAQSIGEPGTQMTLKTFHFAGVASMNVTLGVPRIKEIIDASKVISTPIITAPLVNAQSEQSARIVKGRIERTTLGDIAEYIKEVFEPHSCHLVVKLDMKAIEALQLDITVERVIEAIITTPRSKIKARHILRAGNAKLHILPLDPAQEAMMYSLQQLKIMIPKIIVKGVPAVERAVINQLDDKSYNLLIEGYALSKVMGTPGVIGTRTKSNHVIEMEKTLGIEAGRQTIINEIQDTMKAHGMSIDPRHVTLLSDIMTFKGEVLGITRYGVSKMKDSVLMLASFERTNDHLFNAAVHSRSEHILGVSECIIMGIPIPLGTGMFKILAK
eukprot:TRINITY_DN2924_c0_g2_i5.p1 TRINITY_DN2924_c0_g2~~TRINITY_DN2924_c0_g2_i5.p1  ORF type:complete len:1377 (-),score=291.09 TRINITY_DN2924_c0_g2_i5:73-4203(-)